LYTPTISVFQLRGEVYSATSEHGYSLFS